METNDFINKYKQETCYSGDGRSKQERFRYDDFVYKLQAQQQLQQQRHQRPEEKPIDLTSNRGHAPYQENVLRTAIPNGSTVCYQNANNYAEVLKAAKSLFSKKTRTLYHWMYPNTPKFQLKSAVSMAWDTMGVQEKQFYISQVLGKFGYLQNSLMVNPQLGYMRLSPQMYVDISQVETRSAVSNLLQHDNPGWSDQHQPTKKRGRPKGPKRDDRSKLRRRNSQRGSRDVDDFTDDPELKKELEQFQLALHMVEK